MTKTAWIVIGFFVVGFIVVAVLGGIFAANFLFPKSVAADTPEVASADVTVVDRANEPVQVPAKVVVKEPVAQVQAPEVVQEEVQAPAEQANVPSNDGELVFPTPLPYPDFVGNPDTWMKLLPEEREQKVSEALGVAVNEVERETGVAFAFNADGISVTDIKLIQYLLYEVHIDSGEVLYFLSDGVMNLSDYDGRTTSDATVRIEGFLSAERSADGKLCLPFWNSYEYNGRYGIEVIPLGYFASEDTKCYVVPEAYVSKPDLKDKFEFLYKEAKADLTMFGEWEGVWYFWSDLGSQSITCPEGWTCLATQDDVKGAEEYTYFTDTVTAATAAYLFDPDELDQADIKDFIDEARLIVK